MKTLMISSLGQIENNALTLIGGTTKDGDTTKIGFFGSGLKYTLAYFVRNKIDFRIFSGTREIMIGIKEQEFRGSKFEVLTVDGETTSITSKMGDKDWIDPFMPIREIYSNAIDEGEAVFKVLGSDDELDIKEGTTTFLIEYTESIASVADNYDKYFTFKREQVAKTTSSLDYGEYAKFFYATEKGNCRIYYKGIYVGEYETGFPYDIELEKVTLDEVRKIKYRWSVASKIGRMLEGCENRQVMLAYVNELKSCSNFSKDICPAPSYSTDYVSNVLLNFIRSNRFYLLGIEQFMSGKIPHNAIGLQVQSLDRFTAIYPEIDLCGVATGKGTQFVIDENPSELVKRLFSNAMDLLLESDYKDRLESKYKFCDFKEPSVKAFADTKNKIMYFSKQAIQDYSSTKLASIIIEEQEHIHTDFSDESREFQTHFIQLYANSILNK